MTRALTIACLQSGFGTDMTENLERVDALVRDAAAQGAQIILPPELFQGIYFPTQQNPKWFETAATVDAHACVRHLKRLASELGVVIPISFFEKDGPHFYNSVAVADTNGEILGVYRKSHIPDGPGYQEKYYFRPGDTGFKTWQTRFGAIGVGICWDQWYPEAARAMVLQGAEALLYPTAIGSEPYDEGLDTHDRWQRVMQGHAVANAVPIAAANRIGVEDNDGTEQKYYGHSFIADHTGEIVAELDKTAEGVIVSVFDLDEIAAYRADWGFFRDRRPDLYETSAR
jgi:N-carbamoylputrescine amidase